MESIGPYEIEAVVGSGNMGVVFRATDPIIKRLVAVKVVSSRSEPDDPERARYEERIVREAQVLGKLSHPGIVIIYQAGEDQGRAYIAMEFLEGHSLEKVLKSGPVERALALRILRQAADALDFAHDYDIFHRDVKPSNIMVRPDESIKLIDFGIAKAAEFGKLTETGMAPGTPLYMSPEQFKVQPVTGRTDQYSLAVIAYRMLASRMPFVGASTHEILHKLVNDKPPRPSSINPALPTAVDAVFAKALDKQPVARYASCVDFVSALESALAVPIRGGTTVTAPFWRGRRKHRVLAAAVAAGILAASASLWLVWQDATRRKASHSAAVRVEKQAAVMQSGPQTSSAATRQEAPRAVMTPDAASRLAPTLHPQTAIRQKQLSGFQPLVNNRSGLALDPMPGTKQKPPPGVPVDASALERTRDDYDSLLNRFTTVEATLRERAKDLGNVPIKPEITSSLETSRRDLLAAETALRKGDSHTANRRLMRVKNAVKYLEGL